MNKIPRVHKLNSRQHLLDKHEHSLQAESARAKVEKLLERRAYKAA